MWAGKSTHTRPPDVFNLDGQQGEGSGGRQHRRTRRRPRMELPVGQFENMSGKGTRVPTAHGSLGSDDGARPKTPPLSYSPQPNLVVVLLKGNLLPYFRFRRGLD